MSIIDIIISVVLAASVLHGLRQGFILQVATILGAVAALGVARLEYVDVRHFLEGVAGHSPWLTVISYLIVFLVVWMAIVLVARRIRWLVRALLLGWADRLGGAVIGLIEGAIVIELLLYMGKRVPSGSLHTEIRHSALAGIFLHIVPNLDNFFPHIPSH